MTTTDRTRALYARRRAAGLCVRCGAPSERTRCEECRVLRWTWRSGAYSAAAIMGTGRERGAA